MQTVTPQLTRIHDTRFLYQTDEERPVILNVHGIYDDGYLTYRVALQAYNCLTASADEQTFTLGGRSWKIYPKTGTGGGFWSWVNRVHKVFVDTHAKEYDIKENSYFGSWFSIPENIENVFLPLSDYFAISGISEDNVPLVEEPYTALPFTDPFTALATKAYQNYETFYRNKDAFVPKDCSTRIIYHQNKLHLVSSDDPLALNEKIIRQTAGMYLHFIRKKFGKKKVKQIDFRYQLNLDSLARIGLTPEHIYRVNIGVNYLEIKDLKKIWKSLCDLYHLPHKVKRDVPLDSYFQALPDDFLPGRVKRGIYRFLHKKHARVPLQSDLEAWLKNFISKKSFESLSLNELNVLIYFLWPDKESAKKSLTGREIYGFIRSYYSNAEGQEHKPFVDQQELFQTLQKLIKNPSEDHFYEKLSHVIVKKHLARACSKGKYRVGALIPAPCKEKKVQNWYKVTSCVSIPQGVHSYTLESALPGHPIGNKIKVYRSTSHNGYALRSAGSVFNDLNGLNSPGYEGLGMADPYEINFFQKSTIPLWVAYTYLANQRLLANGNQEKIYQYLKKANRSLFTLSTKDCERRNLRQIIRKHDWILNELYRLSWGLWSKFSAYTSIHEFLKADFNSDQEKKEKEDKLAAHLFKQLEQLSLDEKNPQRKWAIVRLKDELFRHVIFYCDEINNGKIKKAQEKYQEILSFEKELAEKEKNISALSLWAEKLQEIAREQKEDIESKKATNFVLAGHSLGGACAQLAIIHFFVDQDRVPLPSKYCMGYFFDDPAINDEDNERFKNWGYRHRALFKNLNVKFILKRRQEAGDIVPLGGEIHLGATFSKEEESRLKEVYKCDFRLRERLEGAKCLPIALSLCAHETQFEEGKMGVDYRETVYSGKDQGLFDNRGRFYTVYDELNDSFTRKKSDEKIKRQSWEVLRNRWCLSPLYSTFDGERFRTHRYCSLIYYLLMASDTDSRITDFTDDKGIFAVNEKGVVSKKLVQDFTSLE